MLAFAVLLAERTPALLRFATVVTGSPHQAEDVVQDVLVKAHRRWDQIGALDHPEAYLRRMIVNEHLSWRRKWARVVPGQVELTDIAVADPADQVVRHDELVEAVRSLPPKQRAAVALRYYADQTDAEIAELLGCSVSTVRSQIARALAKLRVQVDPAQSRVHPEGVPDANAR